MRIAYLMSISLDTPSALGRWYPWARQLAAWGHDVHVLALHHDLGPHVVRCARCEGVWVHYVGQMHTRKVGDATHYFSPLRLLWVTVSAAVGLAWRAARLRADVYHVCKPHPQNSFAGLVAARLLGRRKLVLDCDDLEASINRFSGAWQRRPLAWLEHRMPAVADRVTVHTRYLERRLIDQGVPRERVLRVPSGVDRRRLAGVSRSDVETWRRRLALGRRRAIVYVGTMALVSPSVDLLLHAFAKLCTRRADATLLLVGGGPDLATIEELARELGVRERCVFTGRVSGQDALALMSLGVVSVDPVHDDTVARARWPVKIVESIGLGVPVITGDVGDRREMLGDGIAGLLVSPGDPRALAEGLDRVLGDEELRRRLVGGCGVQAAQYDLEEIVRALIEWYGE